MSAIWSQESGDPADPLVVVIHGSMDRSAGMLKISRRLDTEFCVLRYDRRGYGRSHPHGGPFAMGEQVADLVAVLAGRRAVLIGHSYGGNVALAAADHHPHLVAGVVVYETPLSWEPWWPGSTAGAAAVAAAGQPEVAAERFMRRIIGNQRWEALPEGTKQTRRAEGVAMVAELADLRQHRPWDPANITCPVVTSFGTLGAAHHRQGMEHLAAQLGCQGIELPDCRHDAPYGHPDVFRAGAVDPLLTVVGPPWSTAMLSPAGRKAPEP